MGRSGYKKTKAVPGTAFAASLFHVGIFQIKGWPSVVRPIQKSIWQGHVGIFQIKGWPSVVRPIQKSIWQSHVGISHTKSIWQGHVGIFHIKSIWQSHVGISQKGWPSEARSILFLLYLTSNSRLCSQFYPSY